MNRHKTKTLLTILCSVLAINANATSFSWFSKNVGDDGNVNTTGNPQAKMAVSTFVIENKSNSIISSVSILDGRGQSLYNDKFACRLDQTCNLIIKNKPLTAELTLKFYDANKQLVSAYLMSNKPAMLNNIIIDDKWLGLYAFNQMVKISKKSPRDLNAKLLQFFNGYSSPDGTLDIFEELGLYFIAQKGGVNENSFYKALNVKLDNNQFLPANKVAKNKKNVGYNSTKVGSVMLFQGNAKAGVCDPVIQSAFSYISQISSFIPVVGDGIAAIFGIGGQIMSDSCPTGNEWIGEKFTEIDNKLKQFDLELKSLNYSIAELSKYVDTNQSENTLLLLDVNYSHLSTDYFNSYASIANQTSLVDYVAKNGGLKRSQANSQQLQNLLSRIPTQLNNFDKLLSNAQISKMKVSLDNVCKDSSKTSGDIISTRNKCNIATSKVLFTLDSSALRLKPMIVDEINVVANAIKSGNVDSNWLQANISQKFIYNGQSYDWDKAAEIATKAIDEKVQFINNTLVGAGGEKLYKSLDGLSATLQQNIINAQCASGNLPAIKEWHTIDNTGRNPYIITECNGEGSRITSKYYYNKRGTTQVDDKVVNAMGVLVPDRFFHGGSNNNYGYDPAFPWADATILTSIENPNKFDYSDSLSTTLNISSGNPKISVIDHNGGPSSISGTVIKANSRVFGSEGSNDMLVAYKPLVSNKFLIKYQLLASSKDLFAIMRYTKGEYTYAWVMRTWSDVDNKGYVIGKNHFHLKGAPQCLTNDCSINNTGAKLDKLEFIDGTSIEWTKIINETSRGYNPIPGYGTWYTEYTINVK